MLIESDIARCRGDGSGCCLDCARKLQLALDERDYPERWYPQVFATPKKGICTYKIQSTKETEN